MFPVSEWLQNQKVVSGFTKCFQTVSEEDALSLEFDSYVETKITTRGKLKQVACLVPSIKIEEKLLYQAMTWNVLALRHYLLINMRAHFDMIL